MKLRIQGREYEMGALAGAHLNDLIALKRDTGLSAEEVEETVGKLVAAGQKLGPSPKREEVEKLISSEEMLLAMGLIVWLSRRRAGERMTLEDACDFPLEQLEILVEASDKPAHVATISAAAGPTRARAKRPASGRAASAGPRSRKTSSAKSPRV